MIQTTIPVTKPKTPCSKNCIYRSAECHAKCKIYQAYVKQQTEFRNYYAKTKEEQALTRAYVSNAIIRMKHTTSTKYLHNESVLR